jgi:hypothetical protein
VFEYVPQDFTGVSLVFVGASGHSMLVCDLYCAGSNRPKSPFLSSFQSPRDLTYQDYFRYFFEKVPLVTNQNLREEKVLGQKILWSRPAGSSHEFILVTAAPNLMKLIRIR